jgi:hypothetical protein
MHFAGGKGQCPPRGKTNHLGRGIDKIANYIALWRQPLEQSDNLKELEPERLLSQRFLYGRLL